MKPFFVMLAVLLNTGYAVTAEQIDGEMALCHVAVSNFVAKMQNDKGYPRTVFGQAKIANLSHSIIVSAPGLLIAIGSASTSTNSLLSKTWHSDPLGTRLVVQHLAHEYVEPIRHPPVWSVKPREMESSHLIRSPIIFKRPERKEIQSLLDALTEQGIKMKPSKEETPNKVLDTYFPKAADGLQKNGQH